MIDIEIQINIREIIWLGKSKRGSSICCLVSFRWPLKGGAAHWLDSRKCVTKLITVQLITITNDPTINWSHSQLVFFSTLKMLSGAPLLHFPLHAHQRLLQRDPRQVIFSSFNIHTNPPNALDLKVTELEKGPVSSSKDLKFGWERI